MLQFFSHIEVGKASSSRDGMELMEMNAIFSLFTSLKMIELVIHAKQFSSEKPVVSKTIYNRKCQNWSK